MNQPLGLGAVLVLRSIAWIDAWVVARGDGWVPPNHALGRRAARIPLGRYVARYCHPPRVILERAEARLAPELAMTEQDFLAFGSSLMRLSAACEGIVEKGEHLFGLATGKDQGEEAISSTMELLDCPLHFVARFSKDTAGIESSSLRAESAARRILETESALQRALDPLAYVRTLFRIEAARLPGEVRQMFNGLNGELETLQRRVVHEFGARFAEIRSLQRALQLFEQLRKDTSKQLGQRGARQVETLRESFATLRESIRENTVRQNGLAGVTAGLAADVNAMLVAMQAHDMVSQRVEHIRHGLHAIQSQFSLVREAMFEQIREQLPGLDSVARLQAAQGRSAREQLEHASQALKASVETVLARIQQLDEDCLVLREYGHVTAAATGTIQILLDAIEEGTELVSEAAQAARTCYEPLEPLAKVAATLSGEIDKAGWQMHRIAINTQLIAVQQGRGTGLEVLAGRMAATAAQVSSICAKAEADAKELTAALQLTIDGFGEVVREGLEIRAMMESDGRARQQALHAIRDGTIAALCDVGTAVEGARRLALEMKTVDLARLCRQIEEIESTLLALSFRTGELCRSLSLEVSGRETAGILSQQYTMDSERRVHAECFGESVDGRKKTDGDEILQEVPVGGGSDLGANVDLF